MPLKLFAVVIPLLLFAHASSSKIPLVIGGVFDIDTKPGDENSASMIPIVRMAIEHVNSCPKTLANYELQMEVKDVKVSRKALQIFWPTRTFEYLINSGFKTNKFIAFCQKK